MSKETEKNVLFGAPETHPLMIAEYEALRAEILKRIELRAQVTGLTLVIFGTVVGVALQNHSSAIALLYPILATFLAANWTYNGLSIKDMGDYIRTDIESKVGVDKIGWQHKYRDFHQPKRRLNFISGGGVFLGTSLLAIVVALTLATFDLTQVILLIVDVVCFSFSVFFLIQFYRKNLPSAVK